MKNIFIIFVSISIGTLYAQDSDQKFLRAYKKDIDLNRALFDETKTMGYYVNNLIAISIERCNQGCGGQSACPHISSVRHLSANEKPTDDIKVYIKHDDFRRDLKHLFDTEGFKDTAVQNPYFNYPHIPEHIYSHQLLFLPQIDALTHPLAMIDLSAFIQHIAQTSLGYVLIEKLAINTLQLGDQKISEKVSRYAKFAGLFNRLLAIAIDTSNHQAYCAFNSKIEKNPQEVVVFSSVEQFTKRFSNLAFKQHVSSCETPCWTTYTLQSKHKKIKDMANLCLLIHRIAYPIKKDQ